jgi:hypothetical protein
MSGLSARKVKPPDPDVMLNHIPDGNRLVSVPEPVERTGETRHAELPEVEAEYITHSSGGVTLAPHTEIGMRWSRWVRNPTHHMLESISQE